MSEEYKSAVYSLPPCLVLKVAMQIGPGAVQWRDRSF